MADPSVLFVDQSGELGGAELCLLDYVTRRRGASRVVLLSEGPFEQRLRNAGVDFEVMSFESNVSKSTGRFAQLAALPRVFSAGRSLARLARGYDLLYANTQKAAIVGAVAARLARRPLVWHLHDVLDNGHFSAANRHAVVRVTNRVASHVIANSLATAEAYRRAGGRLTPTVIHNGIDAGRFAPSGQEKRDEISRRHGLPLGAPLVGLFGRITPWKGQGVLLDALAMPGMEQVQAVIVGDALYTDEDRDYARSLRERSETPSLRGRVHWLGSQDDVPGLMQACDAVVHCSTEPEPFGRVIVEAMLAGRPVIAADAGGAREIVQSGENGLLTPPGDAAAIAAAIWGLLDDRGVADRLAAAGRESAITRFDLDDRARDVDEVLAGVATAASCSAV